MKVLDSIQLNTIDAEDPDVRRRASMRCNTVLDFGLSFASKYSLARSKSQAIATGISSLSFWILPIVG